MGEKLQIHAKFAVIVIAVWCVLLLTRQRHTCERASHTALCVHRILLGDNL